MTASTLTHSTGDRLNTPRRDADPQWSRWSRGTGEPYTLGIEEEVMLLDPLDWSLAQSSDRVLGQLSDDLAAHTSPETHAGVVELMTGIHRDVGAAASEMDSLRQQFRRELRGMGLTAAAAGTHPMTVWRETEISSARRYQMLDESLRQLARREPTMALHVHIGVPAPEDAVRLLNALRRHTPVLLALAANSPFWQGRDTGFASMRTLIFQAFPRTGLPRFFSSYADYVAALDGLIASGAIADPSFLWWDARLQPRLGTVEVRVMDAQSTVEDVAALAALIQSLARLELEEPSRPPPVGQEVLAENRFLAARDGISANLIDPYAHRLVPVHAVLDVLLEACRPHAVALGCQDALEGVTRLMADNGADRQREFAAADGSLNHLVEHLAHRFVDRVQPAAGGDGDNLDRDERWAAPPTNEEKEPSCAAGSPTPDRHFS